MSILTYKYRVECTMSKGLTNIKLHEDGLHPELIKQKIMLEHPGFKMSNIVIINISEYK